MNKIKIIVIAAIAIFATQTAKPMFPSLELVPVKFNVIILNESGKDLLLGKIVVKNGMWEVIEDAGSKEIYYRTLTGFGHSIDVNPIAEEFREREIAQERMEREIIEESTTVTAGRRWPPAFLVTPLKSYADALIVIDKKLNYKHAIFTREELNAFLENYTPLKASIITVSEKSKLAEEQLSALAQQISKTPFADLFKDKMRKLKTFRDRFGELTKPLWQLYEQKERATPKIANLALSQNTFHGRLFSISDNIFKMSSEPFMKAFQSIFEKVIKLYKSDVKAKARGEVAQIKEPIEIVPYLYGTFKQEVQRFKEQYSFSPGVDDEINKNTKQLFSKLISPARDEIKKVFKAEVEDKINKELESIYRKKRGPQETEEFYKKIRDEELPSMIKLLKRQYSSYKGVAEEIDIIAADYRKEVETRASADFDDFYYGKAGRPSSWPVHSQDD